MGDDPIAKMQADFGMAPTDLERAVVVIHDEPKEQIWFVLSSTKPFDKARIAQKLQLDPTERKYEGKSYQVSGRGGPGALHFVNDKLMVVTRDEEVIKLAMDVASGKRKAPGGKLQKALALAAAGKHQAVAGFAIPPELAQMLKAGPGGGRTEARPGGPKGGPQPLPGPGGRPQGRPGPGLPPPPPQGGPGGRQPRGPGGPGGFGDEVGPLLEVQSGSATLNLTGNTLVMEITGDFPDADKAGKAKAKLDQLKASIAALALIVPELADELNKAGDAITIAAAGNSVTVQTSQTIKNEYVAMFFEKMAAGATRTQRLNNLKQIGLAFQNYASANNGKCPENIKGPDGKPLLSSRVAILPYMESNLRFKLDEPWDSPHNKKLLAQMPKVYELPGAAAGGSKTCYQLFTGAKTLYDGNAVTMPASMNFKGTSNLILVVEAAKPVEWTKPDDIPFDPQGDPTKLLRFVGGVCNAVFWDGHVEAIAQTIDPQNLKNAILAKEGGPFKR